MGGFGWVTRGAGVVCHTAISGVCHVRTTSRLTDRRHRPGQTGVVHRRHASTDRSGAPPDREYLSARAAKTNSGGGRERLSRGTCKPRDRSGRLQFAGLERNRGGLANAAGIALPDHATDRASVRRTAHFRRWLAVSGKEGHPGTGGRFRLLHGFRSHLCLVCARHCAHPLGFTPGDPPHPALGGECQPGSQGLETNTGGHRVRSRWNNRTSSRVKRRIVKRTSPSWEISPKIPARAGGLGRNRAS